MIKEIIDEESNWRFRANCGGLEKYVSGFADGTVSLIAFENKNGKTATLAEIARTNSSVIFYSNTVNEYDFANKLNLYGVKEDISIKYTGFMNSDEFIKDLNEMIKYVFYEIVLIDDIDKLFDYQVNSKWLFKELKRISTFYKIMIIATVTPIKETIETSVTLGGNIPFYSLFSQYLETTVIGGNRRNNFDENCEIREVCLFNSFWIGNDGTDDSHIGKSLLMKIHRRKIEFVEILDEELPF